MDRRLLPATTLRLFNRRFNSTVSTATVLQTLKPEPAALTIVNLDDHRKLFASVSTSKLLRSSINLGLASNETFVDFGMWVMNSRLMETSLVRDVILKTVKHTMFEQFCAGETTEEAGECVRKIHDAGLRGMLVYAVEHTGDNTGCDRNLEGFLRCVEFSKSLPPSSPLVFNNLSLVPFFINGQKGKLAACRARNLGIQKGNRRLEFAQLYGMSEALSFGLRNAGFQVSKYLPYGPVDMVMPYLLRRAEENRGLLSTSNIDRVLMWKELKRRIKSLEFGK
ncbi:hypothetical protein GOBAR_DD25720 [Gossypium barbadense]|nr:hypothetical protein GOBAR_DD25720 [Gossypium barbadense]